MTRYIFPLLCLLALSLPGIAQPKEYTTANAHSHNDYLQKNPFTQAFGRNFGSIEADVLERNGELYVAHNAADIESSRTLRSLYLEPLQQAIREKKGIFFKSFQSLQLLIDFKTAGEPTMKALVRQLTSFPDITSHPNVQIVISGNRPPADTWQQYPSYILFDGLPTVRYTPEQLVRIPLFSASFQGYSRWNGKGTLPKEDREKLQAVVDSVHHLHRKIRFWATPDESNAWKTMIGLGVDYLNTDKIDSLADYLQNRYGAQYRSSAPYALYQPVYRNNDQRSKVKHVILLIGDGMGLAQIHAGYTANFEQLNLLQFLNIGFSKTSPADGYITDSAAGATAMASGKKTNNRFIGVDATGVQLPAIPDLIAPMGLESALISAGNITDATPAAFYAHNKERGEMKAIAADFENSPVSIMIGGGTHYFDAALQHRIVSKGYRFSTQLSALDTIRSRKYLVLADSAELSMLEGREEFLTRALQRTFKTLSANKQGSFIMAEGAQIDHGGHKNSVPYLTTEMLDFDKAIGEAMRFADSNGETLVIVTADHETGGLSLLGGDISKGFVEGRFSSGGHSGIMVPVFAYGPHSMDFRGVYENTAIFDKIMQVIRTYHARTK